MPRKKQPGAAASRWPASRVETWPITRLAAYERNTRRHSAEQIELLRASLREFGWTIPVLARPDGTLIAGHGRLEAATRRAIARLLRQGRVVVAGRAGRRKLYDATSSDDLLARGGDVIRDQLTRLEI